MPIPELGRLAGAVLEKVRTPVEEALERRDKQLAEAQQIAQLGSWEWDIRADRMLWSDELYRISGYDPRSFEPSLQAFIGSIHPDDREFVERRIEEALIRPSCLEFEYRIVRPDGEIRSLHCRAEVIATEDRAPERVIGTAHDVTELRSFAHALSGQVEQLQQLSKASVAIYAAEGVEEILEVATGQAMRIVGVRRGRGCITDPERAWQSLTELPEGGSWGEIAGELIAAVEPIHHPLRLGVGEVDRISGYGHLADEQRFLLRGGWLAVPLVDLLGGATGAIQLFEKIGGEFSDGDEAILVQIAQITSLAVQKARLFDELQVSEQRYRRLFNAHLSGDFVTAVDGTFLEVNHTLARILGYDSPDSLKKLNVARLYPDPSLRDRVVERIRREGRAIQHETEFLRADGSVVHVIMNVVGVFDRAGALVALQGCLFDITDQKAAEAALRESQQQLLQAQKMEALGQLAGGIAHDFNNMLMAIQGFTRLLEEEIPPEESTRGHLVEIRKAADRSTRLTLQLLAYSRKQVLQPEVLDLNSAVDAIEGMLKRLIGAHIVYTSELDPAAGRVHADPGQLQQVLMNLVLNARDAMPSGGRVTVRTGSRSFQRPRNFGDFKIPPGAYATLTVTDTGCGIPPADMGRIYEPFFTTKGVGQGSGLGLSTVYGIVKQTGGYIVASSQIGEGTAFTLYLPRTQAPSPLPPEQSPARQEQGGGATVLVAEDESVLRTLAAIVLRRSGFNVLVAEDGIEAFAVAQEQGFEIDVLVTDLVMPRMGGQALAERLLQKRPDLGLVFMSGYAEEAVTGHGRLAEGSVFLAKPFSPSLLAETVWEVLSQERVGAIRA
jgi:PAS domain S-box-containing protein